MRTRNIVVAGAVAAAVLLAGCSGGATIPKPSVLPGSPFCTDIGTFATRSAGVADAAGLGRTAFVQAMTPIHTELVKLSGEAPAADTVNGKSLKADLATATGGTSDMISAVESASTDAGVKAALATVNAKEGQAMTDAIGRIDAYASQVCKVSAPAAATTVIAPATTAVPLGPVGSTSATG